MTIHNLAGITLETSEIVVWYGGKSDRVIYGPATADFDSLDWMRLALAAMDQSGMGPHDTCVRDLTEAIADIERESGAAPTLRNVPVAEVST